MPGQAKRQDPKPTIRFQATLLPSRAGGKAGSGSVLALPKPAGAALTSREATMVEGALNGFPFRAALHPAGNGGPQLALGPALQDAAGTADGDTVTVEITRVGEEPEIRVPVELRAALAAAPAARPVWAEITPMARRAWILWIVGAKQEATRQRRIAIACDKLASGDRRPCCAPGINWQTKDHVPPDATWQPLPEAGRRASAKSPRS